MLYFLIHYDSETGEILERRPNNIDYVEPIPLPYIEVSQIDFESTLNGNKRININSKKIEDIVPTLDELKENKKHEISYAFDNYVSGKATISLGWDMQFNQRDILMVDGIIRFMEMTNQTEGYLTDADNINHYNLSIADMKQSLLEMTSFYVSAHQKKQMLRSQIEACTTIEELNNIVW